MTVLTERMLLKREMDVCSKMSLITDNYCDGVVVFEANQIVMLFSEDSVQVISSVVFLALRRILQLDN